MQKETSICEKLPATMTAQQYNCWNLHLKKKQKVIVTIIDDEDVFDDLPVGILSRYASPDKRLLEEGAFERAMAEKHDNG